MLAAWFIGAWFIVGMGFIVDGFLKVQVCDEGVKVLIRVSLTAWTPGPAQRTGNRTSREPRW